MLNVQVGCSASAVKKSRGRPSAAAHSRAGRGTRRHRGQVALRAPSAAPAPRDGHTLRREPARRRSTDRRSASSAPDRERLLEVRRALAASHRRSRRCRSPRRPARSQPRPPIRDGVPLLHRGGNAKNRRASARSAARSAGSTPCPVTSRNPTSCSASSTAAAATRHGRRPDAVRTTGSEVDDRYRRSRRLSDVLVPQFGLRGDEVGHHRHAPLVVQHADRRRRARPASRARRRTSRASPTTTRQIPNCRTSPQQYQHGDSVVTMIVVAVVALPPGVPERRRLAVHRRVVVLHAPVVAAAEQRAVGARTAPPRSGCRPRPAPPGPPPTPSPAVSACHAAFACGTSARHT